MTRLFVSLYALVLLGLFAIGWGSEALWRTLNQEKQADPLAQAMQLIPLSLSQFRSPRSLVEQFEQIFNSPVNIISEQDLAWPDAQIQQLKQGIAINSYDQNEFRTIYQYWPAQAKIIEIGPIAQGNHTDQLRFILRSISYLVLAVFIAAWTWPLWRDLRSLQSTSQYYARGLFKHQTGVKKSSSIYPLASSFQAMAEQISQLIEEQRQLVNAVSHDLRTPLSRIKFSFGLLPKDTLEQLPDVREDINELEKLIDELLSYARLDSQTQKLNLDYVLFNQLISHQANKLALQTDKQIQVQIKGEINWLCDGYLIERCLLNLLSNACRYSQSKVLLNVFCRKNQLYIIVEDDGEGIEPKDYQTVFKPFSRLDSSRNKNSAGFGLGLAIVQKICHWHQGNCYLSRSLMGGAKFAICLPSIESPSSEMKQH
ncbi:ATP-binding protein [Catenovulum adriaticum]|uniref:histidine kinase n=1 Tax=Catenovulum adriaticum TaxID=2984846 RepID=A0ABY7AP37_9ALTE|nr:ATP-binding protein [Catenovulum sp. TS8]WAJ71070.1 ATP-binding protein [Catenovulum sp. TS8]